MDYTCRRIETLPDQARGKIASFLGQEASDLSSLMQSSKYGMKLAHLTTELQLSSRVFSNVDPGAVVWRHPSHAAAIFLRRFDGGVEGLTVTEPIRNIELYELPHVSLKPALVFRGTLARLSIVGDQGEKDNEGQKMRMARHITVMCRFSNLVTLNFKDCYIGLKRLQKVLNSLLRLQVLSIHRCEVHGVQICGYDESLDELVLSCPNLREFRMTMTDLDNLVLQCPKLHTLRIGIVPTVNLVGCPVLRNLHHQTLKPPTVLEENQVTHLVMGYAPSPCEPYDSMLRIFPNIEDLTLRPGFIDPTKRSTVTISDKKHLKVLSVNHCCVSCVRVLRCPKLEEVMIVQ